MELARLRPDVLITRHEVTPAEARGWRSAAGESASLVVLVVLADGRGTGSPVNGGTGSPVDGKTGNPVDGVGTGSPGEDVPARTRLIRREVAADPAAPGDLYPAALALAEREWLEAVTAPALATRLARSRSAGGREVALIGAGVVNLVTALRLVRDGYRVTVHDRSPDPRAQAPWAAYGCSRGGGDARMFTLTEADGYHWTAGRTAPFRTPLSEGGWSVAEPSSLTERDLAWVREGASIPPWLAEAYTEDILLFNRRARDLWEEFVHEEPELFHDAGLRRGILRLYTDPHHLRVQVARQERVGALRRVLAPAEIAERHPALREAHAAGVFAGGVEVTGFTVQIHRFVAGLVDLLEKAGATLRWERPVSVPDTYDTGDLAKVRDGPRADHYVLSPGVYGGGLLRGTASDGLIHGVLGGWVSVPNPAPELVHSLKIGRTDHLTEDANVTVTTDPDGRSTLAIGSGYGWTGANPSNIDPAELDVLYRAVEDTVSRFFPGPFEEARRSGLLDESRRYCVRPWTASSLAVLELMEHPGGGLVVVTGGHNTGGFAQAPAVAEAVADALAGRSNPMHTRCHPDRLRLFLSRR